MLETRDEGPGTPRDPPAVEYLCGLDLGQQSDFTAFVVVRKSPIPGDGGRPKRSATGYDVSNFEVPHIERFPLGTPYPRIVASVAALMARPELNPPPESWIVDPLRGTLRPAPARNRVAARPILCVDSTGLGRPVCDMLRNAGLRDLVAITFTGGQAVSQHGYGEINVAKQHLVGAVQYVLSDGRLRIARGIAHADVMLRELREFKVKVTQAARETFGAEGGAHDDLVTALCMPIWYASHHTYSAGAIW